MLSLVIFAGCAPENENTNKQLDANLTILGKEYNFYNYSHAKFSLVNFLIDKEINSNVLNVDENFKQIINDIQEKYKLDNISDNIISVSFYGKNLNLNIEENITGFSFLLKSDEGVEQLMYKLENKTAKLISEYSKEYKEAMLIESYGLFSHKINEHNDSFLTIITDNKSNPSSRIYTTDPKIDIALLEQYPIIFTSTMAIGHYCTVSGCDTTNHGFCAFNSGARNVICEASSYLEDTTCATDDVPNGPTREQLMQLNPHATSSMYYIRDNILSLSTRGKQYIDYYYKISYVLKVTGVFENNPSSTTAVLDFLQKKSVLFTSSLSNSVILSPADAIYIKTTINNYKTLTPNLEFQSILNTLTSDVTNLTGKTKSEILIYFL